MLSLPRRMRRGRIWPACLVASLSALVGASLASAKAAPAPAQKKAATSSAPAPVRRQAMPPLPPRAKVELERLSPAARDSFEQIVADEFCGCDSPLTLASCLKERPSCQLAHDLGVVLARALGVGMPRQSAQVMLSQHVLGPFCSLASEIDTQGAPSAGKVDAPLQLIEFFDYRCTHCKAAQPAIHRALAVYGERVRLISMPIALVEKSVSADAAEAALAAAAQNKFAAMHTALFAREAQDFTPQVLHELAQKAKLDLPRFDREMAAHTYAGQLKRHMKQFLALGLDGTPAFFLNGRRFEFEPTLLPIEERLQMEMDRSLGNCQ